MAQPKGLNGAEMIVWERNRQILEEHYDAERDDQRNDGSLVQAAICYAAEAGLHGWVATELDGSSGCPVWPWAPDLDKRSKHGRIRSLAIAGALIAAEIDRELRKEVGRADNP